MREAWRAPLPFPFWAASPRLREELAEPDKGPAGALSQQRQPAEAPSLPPKLSERLSVSPANPGCSEARRGRLTTAQMGWEAPPPSSSDPEAEPLIFFKKKTNKKPHDLEYSFQNAGPFWLLQGVRTGEGALPCPPFLPVSLLGS